MVVRPGDTLIVYGRVDTLSGLGQRRSGSSGELAHVDGVVERQYRRREEHADLEEPSDS